MKQVSLFIKYLTWSVCMIVSCLAYSQEGEYEVLYEATGTANINGIQTVVPIPIPATHNGPGLAMSSYKKEELFLRLDMGDNFVNGGHTWSYSINADYTVTSLASYVSNTVTLSIGDQTSGTGTPENYIKIFSQDNLFGSANAYPTSVSLVLTNGNSSGSAFSSSLVNGNTALRFQLLAKKEVVYETIDGTVTGTGVNVIPSPSQMTVQGLYQTNTTYRKVKFNWADLHFPQYEVQILKVEPTKNAQLTTNWDNALSVIVKGKTNYEYTPSAGTGYYAWRLRGIGNRYEGGLGNPKNYGEWSTAPSLSFSGLGFSQSNLANPYKITMGTPVQAITSTPQTYRFFYIDQFDDDLNWSYNHVMVEDGREKETMTYANGIGQVKQVQTKLESSQKVFATETVYDYSGRAALSTMVAPTGDEAIQFDNDFFENNSGTPYSAADFDKNSTLFHPSAVDHNSPLVQYYDDQTEGEFKDLYIPQNEGKVFTRTQFHTDATSRPWRTAGVGEKFKLSENSDPNVNHNIIAEYSSVSQDELDRILGSEAPLANTVYKVQNTDANGVKSVSYIAKAGQTIATMLNNDVQLDNLTNVGDSKFTVNEYLDPIAYIPGVDVGTSSKVIMVTGTQKMWANKPKVSLVELDYKFTPATFGVDCDNSCTDCGFCKDCDYHIEIHIKNQQYPFDEDKNATLSFDYTPNPSVDCSTAHSLIDFSDLQSSSRISNLQLLNPSGVTSVSSHFSMLLSDGEMFLESGTYTIERTVAIRNDDPSTGFQYMQAYLDDLRVEFENEWTKNSNCCGPVTLDSTFTCDTLPDIDCENDPDAQSRIDNLTDQIFDLIQKEQDTLLGTVVQGNQVTSYYYHTYLANSNTGVLSHSYTVKSTLRAKIEDMICNQGISSNTLINCIDAYKGALETNIQNATLVFNGQAGNATGPNNPAVQVSESLDVLEGIFNCVGYDYNNSACDKYKMVVFYQGGNSPEEQLAITQAGQNSEFKYYIVFDENTNTNTISSSAHQSYLNSGQAALLETQTPNAPNPDLKFQNNRNCYEQFKYPNGLTGNMTDEEARAYLANMFCECINASDPGAHPNPSDPLPDYAAIITPCKDNCYAKEAAFEVAINNYVLGENIKEDSVYSDEIDSTTMESIWGMDKTWEPIFTATEIECYKTMMTSKCLQQCDMPITTHIGTSQFLQDMQDDNCTNGCPGAGCTIHAADYIEGSTGTYTCLEDFMNSYELKNALKNEQLEFQQAFLYGAEFAPVDVYEQVATVSLFEEEVIEFIEASINNGASYRNPFHNTANTTADYKHSFHPISTPSQGSPVTQTTKTWTVKSAAGTNHTLTAVTNIVWDERGSSNALDWAIIELNVAFYCGEVTSNNYHKNRIAAWAYSPLIEDNRFGHGCAIFEPGSLVPLDIRSQVAAFSFDKTGILHAKPVTSACNFSWADAHYREQVLDGKYSAMGSITINGAATASINNYILLEYGVLSNATYIMDNTVHWQAAGNGLTAQEATAQALVEEINATVTTPKFSAERTGNQVTIYIAANHPEALASVAPITKTGGISISSSVPDIEWLEKPLSVYMQDCGEGTIIQSDCPYGYDKIEALNPQGTPNVYQGYILPADNQNLANEVKNFISKELKEIIINPTETINPKFNLNAAYGIPLTFTANQLNMNVVHCEKSKEIVIKGHAYELIVSLAGVVESNYTDLANDWMHAFLHIEMSCKDDPNSKLFEFNYGEGKALINLGGGAGLGMDKLWEFSNHIGQGTNILRNTWSASNLEAIPVIFDDISFTTDASGELDRFNFKLNLTNNVLNVPYFPIYQGSIGAPGAGTIGGITYTNPNYTGIVTHAGYFYNFSPTHNFFQCKNVGYTILTGLGTGVLDMVSVGSSMTYQSCPPVASCEMCMRWKMPESNVALLQVEKVTCEDELEAYYEQQINTALEECFENKVAELKENYTNCLKNYSDEVRVEYDLNYGQYTLYYYDRAGNLIQTVPPAGVKTVDLTTANRNKLASFRAGNNAQFLDPGHKMITKYRYNSIKQLKWQETPDGGVTEFAYNALGQLVISQDALQKANTKYSYSRYDYLGRVVEAGQFTSNLGLASLEQEAWNNAMFPYVSSTTPIAGITNLEERTYTEYGNTVTPSLTLSSSPLLTLEFTNLRNRVYRSYNDDGYESRYSYDQHGNVALLAQYTPELGWRTIEYDYDILSGNVNEVCYNCKFNSIKEQFRHRYTYDEDNRIVNVETSKDGVVWDTDAHYDYYAHGPLARTEIGEDKIQGIDYTYTSEGYLKGINQVELDKRGGKDPGMDGAYMAVFDVNTSTSISQLLVSCALSPTFDLIANSITVNASSELVTAIIKEINKQYSLDPVSYPFRADKAKLASEIQIYTSNKASYVSNDGSLTLMNDFEVDKSFAADEFAMELGYYDGDFYRSNTFIGGNSQNNNNPDQFALQASAGLSTTANSLYNGNIAFWHTNTRKGQENVAGNDAYDNTVNVYRYDVLNRILENDFQYFDNNLGAFKNGDNRYDERFEYDANGNITSLRRHGNADNGNTNTLMMDNMIYHYHNISGEPSNRLNYVADAESWGNGTTGDDIKPGQGNGNYTYYANGALKTDVQEKLTITWNALKKVKQVYDADNNQTLKFYYDPMGNRVKKEIWNGSTHVSSKHYLRDAQGNVMATYDEQHDGSTHTMKVGEYHLYGSSRIGVVNHHKNISTHTGSNFSFKTTPAQTLYVDPTQMSTTYTRDIGHKNYELTDHLGNVRAVVGDKRIHTEQAAEAIEEESFFGIGMIDHNWKASHSEVTVEQGRLKICSDKKWGGIKIPIQNMQGKTVLLNVDINNNSMQDTVNISIRDSYQYTNYLVTGNNVKHVELPFYVYSNDVRIKIERYGKSIPHCFYVDNVTVEELVEEQGEEIGLNGIWHKYPSSNSSIVEINTSVNTSRTWNFTGVTWDRVYTKLNVNEGDYYLVRSKVKSNTIDGNFDLYIRDDENATWDKRQYNTPADLGDYGVAFRAQSSEYSFYLINIMYNPQPVTYFNQLEMEGATLHRMRRKGVVLSEKFDHLDGWKVDVDAYLTPDVPPTLRFDNNKLKVEQPTANASAIMKEFNVEEGKYYRVKLDVDFSQISTDPNFVITVRDQQGPLERALYDEKNAELVFRARSNKVAVHLGSEFTGTLSKTYYIDNVELAEMEKIPNYVQSISNTGWSTLAAGGVFVPMGNTALRILGNDQQGVQRDLSSFIEKENYYTLEATTKQNNPGDKRVGIAAHQGSTPNYGDWDYDWLTSWSVNKPVEYAFKANSNTLHVEWKSRDNSADFTVDHMQLYKLQKGNVVSTSDFNHAQSMDEIVDYYRPGQLFYKHSNGSGNMSGIDIENVQGRLKVTTSSDWEGATKKIHTVPGKYYRIVYDEEVVRANGATSPKFVMTARDGLGSMHFVSRVNGKNEYLFRAREKVTTLAFDLLSSSNGGTFYLDDFQVFEMKQVPGNVLQVVPNTLFTGFSGAQVSTISNGINIVADIYKGARASLTGLIDPSKYYAFEANIQRTTPTNVGMQVYYQNNTNGDQVYDHSLAQNGVHTLLFSGENATELRFNSRANGGDFDATDIVLYELEVDRELMMYDFELESTPFVDYGNGGNLVYDNTNKKMKVYTPAIYRGLQQSIITIPGEKYIVDFDLECSNGNSISAALASFTTQNASGWWTGIPNGITVTQNGHYQYVFEANKDHTVLVWEKNNAAVSGITEYFELTNLTVRKQSQNLVAETFDDFNGWEAYGYLGTESEVSLELVYPSGVKVHTGSNTWKGIEKRFTVVPGQSYDLTTVIDQGSIVSGNLVYSVKYYNVTDLVSNFITGTGTQTHNSNFTIPTGVTEIIFRLEKASSSANNSPMDYFILKSFTLTPSGVQNYYTADVKSYTDYYAFGSTMPNRNYASGDYSYGFNGMEKDDEMKGSGNSYTTEFRQLDSRLGIWLSLDPLMAKYPYQSPYATFNNNPIYFKDPSGLEGEDGGTKKTSTEIVVNTISYIDNDEDELSKDGKDLLTQTITLWEKTTIKDKNGNKETISKETYIENKALIDNNNNVTVTQATTILYKDGKGNILDLDGNVTETDLKSIGDKYGFISTVNAIKEHRVMTKQTIAEDIINQIDNGSYWVSLPSAILSVAGLVSGGPVAGTAVVSSVGLVGFFGSTAIKFGWYGKEDVNLQGVYKYYQSPD